MAHISVRCMTPALFGVSLVIFVSAAEPPAARSAESAASGSRPRPGNATRDAAPARRDRLRRRQARLHGQAFRLPAAKGDLDGTAGSLRFLSRRGISAPELRQPGDRSRNVVPGLLPPEFPVGPLPKNGGASKRYDVAVVGAGRVGGSARLPRRGRAPWWSSSTRIPKLPCDCRANGRYRDRTTRVLACEDRYPVQPGLRVLLDEGADDRRGNSGIGPTIRVAPGPRHL